jgi:ubiquinone/menaquinone biosynthesis C-methylase UbiE
MSKMRIREIEEELPTIGVTIAKLPISERLSVEIIYRHATRMLVKIGAGSHILEVGCGDGLLLNEISDKIGSHFSRYTGVDFSLNKLKCAHDRSKRLGINGNTNFVLADAENLPFAQETFGVAVMLEVLEHLLTPSVYVDELARCVKLSGKAVITTPSAYGIGRKLSLLRAIFLPTKASSSRTTYIIINGKQLPHKDFTLLELQNLISQRFVLKKIYSFNFGLQTITKHLLPENSVAVLTNAIEDKANCFPYMLGHNWAILCEKVAPSTTKN